MTERNPYIDAGKGAQAKDLIENPILVEAFATLERKYLEAWRQSKPADQEERERLWLAVGILGEIQRHLRVVVDNGIIAARDIDKLSGRK
ncbi:MAG: hypothetical protein ACO3V1_10665 [Candidatus Nanopelagicales bacterium]